MSTSKASSPAPNVVPTDSPQEKHPGQHTRNYQACIPCRRRKVKCDLGPVDNPNNPPCARCRRETKDCYFSPTRRKRKVSDNVGEDSPEEEEVEIRNGRKRQRVSLSEADAFPRNSGIGYLGSDVPPITPGGSLGRSRPLPRPSQATRRTPFEDESERIIDKDTTARLQKSELYNTNDTMNMLSEITEASAAIKRRRTLSESGHLRPDPTDFGLHPSDTPRKASFMRASQFGNANPSSADNHGLQTLAQASGIHGALLQWQQTRFVRAEWFTASEAIRYIDFFYEHLLPLSPITVPDFKDPSTHHKLLREEPMLTVTLLTIASRHLASETHEDLVRNIMVHQRLWEFLKSMISRVAMGEECNQTEPIHDRLTSGKGKKKVGLRSLGAIESLLILTEWHPHAIHLPSCDYGDEILIEEPQTNDHQNSPEFCRMTTNIDEACAREAEKRKTESWVYPLERGNRMAWSFIGMAVNIAYELGLMNGGTMPPSTDPTRVENVRRLLYIFSVQTSGRLSLPSMIAQEHWNDVFNNIKDESHFIHKPPPPDEVSHNEVASKVHIQETVHHFWYRIAYMFADANKKLFPSVTHCKDVIASGTYRSLLDQLDQQHKDWRLDFDACGIIPEQMRHILDVEFYYMRVYCHNIALQAVVNRCINNEPNNDGKAYRPESLAKWMGEDRKYIDMIIEDSQAMLTCVADKLYRSRSLKHVPNRTLLRLPSVSTVLVKTFTYGIEEESVKKSFNLLDRTAQALSETAVDDLHIASSFAALIENLTSRVRAAIVRVNKKSRSAKFKVENDDSADQSAPGAGLRAVSPSPPLPPPSMSPGQTPSFGGHRGAAQYKPSPLNNVALPPLSPSRRHGLDQMSYAPNDYAPHDANASSSYRHGLSEQASSQAGDFRYHFQAPREISFNAAWGQPNPPVMIMPPPGFTSADQMQVSGEQHPAGSGYTTRTAPPATPGGVTSNMAVSSATSPWDPFAQTPSATWFGLDINPLTQHGPAEVHHSDFGPVINGQDMLDLVTPSSAPQGWPDFSEQG